MLVHNRYNKRFKAYEANSEEEFSGSKWNQAIYWPTLVFVASLSLAGLRSKAKFDTPQTNRFTSLFVSGSQYAKQDSIATKLSNYSVDSVSRSKILRKLSLLDGFKSVFLSS